MPTKQEFRTQVLQLGGHFQSTLHEILGAILATKDELSAQLDDLQASATAANDKADALIVVVTDGRDQVAALNQQIADLIAAGGATASELQVLSDKATAIKAGLTDQIAQDDAALNPSPASPAGPAAT